MFKKLSCIFLTVMLIMVSAMPTYANSPEVKYFSDGSYVVTTIFFLIWKTRNFSFFIYRNSY